MAGHRSSLRVIAVIALCFIFSYLMSAMNSAVPVARTRSLMMATQEPQDDARRVLLVDSWRSLKMLVELDDYPGSGANNRHTPKPQLGRGCVDC